MYCWKCWNFEFRLYDVLTIWSFAKSYAGIMECWSVGVSEFWSSGVVEFWSVGVWESLGFGVLVFGVLENWSSGVLKLRSFGVLDQPAHSGSSPRLLGQSPGTLMPLNGQGPGRAQTRENFLVCRARAQD